ncbi:MAG TPA: hypothetical protein V6D06_18550, partial [Trichocoleus sp.]
PMPRSPKTPRILERFPDFYRSENPEDLLHRLVDVFGQTLDAAESDLMRVLRSHFVNTAENAGSQGLSTVHRGDLDRLFALYLEQLGGTTQLIRTNQQLQASDIKQFDALLGELTQPDNPLAHYIWQRIQQQADREHVWLNRYLAMAPVDLSPALLPLLLNRQDLPHLLERYRIERVHFGARDISATLVIRLITGQDALTCYLRSQFSTAAQTALNAYCGADPVPDALRQALATDLTAVLPNPVLQQKFQDRQRQIQLVRSLDQIARVPLPDNRAANAAQTLRKRISLDLQKDLFGITPSNPPEATLSTRLSLALRPLLQDLGLVQTLLQGLNTLPEWTTAPSGLPLSDQAMRLVLRTAKTALAEMLQGPTFNAGVLPTLPQLTADVVALLEQAPTGDDLQRLNRRLLEAAYREVPVSPAPSKTALQQALIKALNEAVLPDPNFYARNQTSFAEVTLPLEAQQLIDQQKLAPLSNSDKTRLNRLLLETAYPLQIEKGYIPYRERFKRLIAVLKMGASTREGIVDIVAANLGMPTATANGIKPWETPIFSFPLQQAPALDSLSASPALQRIFAQFGIALSYDASVVVEAPNARWQVTDISSGQVYLIRRQADQFSVYRHLIRVIEFAPALQRHTVRVHPHPGALTNLPPQELPFELNLTNPNPVPTLPAVQIRIHDHRPESAQEGNLLPLSQLRLRHVETGLTIGYEGMLNCGETVAFLPDGTVLINGVAIQTANVVSGSLPPLPVGPSRWRISAQTGFSEAAFDSSLFDFSLFEAKETRSLNPEQAQSYALEVSVSFYRLSPGCFTVKIPWDIPGYTDQFNETRDHPRHQIYGLLEKVKAAGVQPHVNYERQFTEEHDIAVDLRIVRSPFEEKHDLRELSFDIRNEQKPYGQGLVHEVADTLITAAVFDYTRFDSLNTFA